MFATVSTVSAPENFWGKIKYNLLPPPVRTECVHVAGGGDFIHMTVPIVRGKIYWSNVRAQAGAAAQNILLPRELAKSEPVELRPFQSNKLMSMVTINSFFKLVRLLPGAILEQECTFIDYPGTLARAVAPLPRYCRTIRIVTANAPKYREFVRESLEQFGCAVCLNEDSTKAFASPVILIPHRAAFPTAFSSQSLVFSAFRDNLYCAELLTPEGISLPQKYLSLLPKGIPAGQFACALYELSGVGELAASVAPAFRRQNRILSYREVVSMLD